MDKIAASDTAKNISLHTLRAAELFAKLPVHLQEQIIDLLRALSSPEQ